MSAYSEKLFPEEKNIRHNFVNGHASEKITNSWFEGNH